MTRRVAMRLLPIAILTLALSTPVVQAEGPVRVYTNVDLLQFGPPPPPDDRPAAPAQDAELGWTFVTDFIEREHARLDRERRDDLDRQLVEARVNEIDRRAERSGIALPYYYGFGYYGYGAGGRGHGVGHKTTRGFARGHVSLGSQSGLTGLFSPIVPLHARRPLTHGRPVVGHGNRVGHGRPVGHGNRGRQGKR